MKIYIVDVSRDVIYNYALTLQVEAENEEQARSLALEAANETEDWVESEFPYEVIRVEDIEEAPTDEIED